MRLLLLFLGVLVVNALSSFLRGESPHTRLAILLRHQPAADFDRDGTVTAAEAREFHARVSHPAADGTLPRSRRTPDAADVVYGPRERHRFDLWLPSRSPDAGLPLPVVIFFHGGGFVMGDKSHFSPEPFLEAGMACVSANYRFVNGDSVLSPEPLRDGARVVQTLRHRAKDWNLDPGRIAITGYSAGAVVAMWVAYSDDLAHPESKDAVARESSRVTCIVPLDGPTNLHPDWIRDHLGGPTRVHDSFTAMFGAPADGPMSTEIEERIRASSPWELVSPDDPATLLVYSGTRTGLPFPESAPPHEVIHHPYFGDALKRRLDEHGIESALYEDIDPARSSLIVEFLLNQFGMRD